MIDPTLLTELQSIRKEMKDLKKMLITQSESQWINNKEAANLLGVSVRTLNKMRLDGLIKSLRVRPSGRGYQYKKSELEKLFIQSK